MTTLDDIKPGDEVAKVTYCYGIRTYERAKVTRATKAQIMVNSPHALGGAYERVFWRKNGAEVGRSDGGERTYLAAVDDAMNERIQATADKQECDRITGYMQRVRSGALTLDQLRRIAAILGEDGG